MRDRLFQAKLISYYSTFSGLIELVFTANFIMRNDYDHGQGQPKLHAESSKRKIEHCLGWNILTARSIKNNYFDYHRDAFHSILYSKFCFSGSQEGVKFHRVPDTSYHRHFIFQVTSYQREKLSLHTSHLISSHFIQSDTSYQSLHTSHFISATSYQCTSYQCTSYQSTSYRYL